jgi:hypothetical protein
MRTYKRKTERGTTSQKLLQRAADAVIKDGRKLKTVARELEICHTTLKRFVKKLVAGQTPTVGYKPRVVFNAEQEASLASYILTCSSIYFGLLPEEVKKLAYECATKFEIQNIPESWHENGMAGKDWFSNFIKRNSALSIRTPEATSASRATSFNRYNVNQFFEKLGNVLTKHKVTPSRIWNLDETGVQTVLKPKKIVAAKGTKQVGAVVSAERGTLVTVELAANAIGNTIPPMFVFPRLKFKDLFIRDGPPECIGAGNSSGWMTSTEFLIFMDHFIKYTKPTPSEPVLLLLDNHSSHIDIKVVEKAKENSVIMLSFPPHCTHRLQPLDVGFNGPFKSYCAKAQDNWLRNNPGKTMSIYEIPGIVKYAWPLASTPTNICNAFKKAGIWPYDPNVFTDDDFAPSFVTDRSPPESQSVPVDLSNEPGPSGIQYPEIQNSIESASEEIAQENNLEDPEESLQTARNNAQQEAVRPYSPELIPGYFVQQGNPQPGSSNDMATFSPEIIRPLPKAPARISGANKRRARKAAVLTDTPEKNALAEEQAKKKKKEGNSTKVKGAVKENIIKGQRKKKISREKERKNQAKRKVLQEDNESDDEEDELEW